MTFLRALTELPDPLPDDDGDTKPIITLPTLPHDPTPVVTMTDGNLIVGTVRIGSIVHRLMIAKGYKVVRS